MTTTPSISVEYLLTCLEALKLAHNELLEQEVDSPRSKVYRSAIIKEFEIVLEQSYKLLRRRLRPFFATNRAVYALTFKDCFRYAAQHSLITNEACIRWLEYRDSRNKVAHDYGESLAQDTLTLMPSLVEDAYALAEVLAEDVQD